MASLTISSASVQQPYNMHHEPHAAENSVMMDTVRRVSPLALGLIAGIIAAVILGPISGLLIGAGVALLASMVTASCWDANLDQHQPGYQPTPWYQRTVNWIPSFFYTPVQPVIIGSGFGSGNAPHVQRGGGHFHSVPEPHPAPPPFGAPPVQRGGGHFHSVPEPHPAPPPFGAPPVQRGGGHFHSVPEPHPAPPPFRAPPVHPQGPPPAAAPPVQRGGGHFHSAPVPPQFPAPPPFGAPPVQRGGGHHH